MLFQSSACQPPLKGFEAYDSAFLFLCCNTMLAWVAAKADHTLYSTSKQ